MSYYLQHNQEISFNKSFKILQVSDLHFGNGATDYCFDITDKERNYSCNSLNSTNFIKSVYELEKPDMVVYTGDVIDGGAKDGITSLNLLFEWIYTLKKENRNPYLALILGNHDGESNLLRAEVAMYASRLPKSVVHLGSPGVYGYSNYIVTLKSSLSKYLNLYFFDSGSYLDDGYDRIRISQIDWYREKSKQFQKNSS